MWRRLMAVVAIILLVGACGVDRGNAADDGGSDDDGGAAATEATECEALDPDAEPAVSVGIRLFDADRAVCAAVADCLAQAAAEASSDPAGAGTRIRDCLNEVVDGASVAAIVGMPGLGTLMISNDASATSWSVQCGGPSLDPRLADEAAGGTTSSVNDAMALYAEAAATDDPAERDDKTKQANLLIAAAEQDAVLSSVPTGSGDGGGGGGGNWVDLAAAASTAAAEVIKAGAADDSKDANQRIFDSVVKPAQQHLAPKANQRTARDADDPCAAAQAQFDACNSKGWKTEQCKQLRTSILNPNCDQDAVLTADGTPCGLPEKPTAEQLLAAEIALCHQLVRGTDGTDPCQPPAFAEWSHGSSGPTICSDPAALTGVDQCLPGLLPPDDLDRKLHAQQLAVLATLLEKYGGAVVVVVDPRGPRTQ